jgi:hypothetical protein
MWLVLIPGPSRTPRPTLATLPAEPARGGPRARPRHGGCGGAELPSGTGGLLCPMPPSGGAPSGAPARARPPPSVDVNQGSKGSRIIQIGIARS